MKRGLNILTWLGVVAYLIVVLGLVSDKVNKSPCQSLHIAIMDSADNHFVSNNDINNFIIQDQTNILGGELSKINTKELEGKIRNTPFVKTTEIFKSSNGKLNVYITQREPIIRVIDERGVGYYIDKEANIMPLGEYYTARVVVANGWNLAVGTPGDNLIELKANDEYRRIYELYQLGFFIYSNDFWRAQIEQIHLTKFGEFQLTPRVGAHIIEFGDISNYQDKFNKLYALYNQGFKNEGWNKYLKIDLKYKNQVVCTKR